MEVEITLKNYRCFTDSRPARFTFQKGFTSFIGVNNSGKSSLLKFFYEFRNLFHQIYDFGAGYLLNALRGNEQQISFPREVPDPEEVFTNSNKRNLEIVLRILSTETPSPLTPDRLVISISRGAKTWTARIHMPNGQIEVEKHKHNLDGHLLSAQGVPLADLSSFHQISQNLIRSLYIGPFRNAINVEAHDPYFDIQVGQDFIQAWRRLKTGSVKAQNSAAYRLTEDIRRIFRFTSLEINSSDDNKTLQTFVNGESYKLLEVGSGITQFILVLASAATRQPAYIFIDEPELNLHPSLQIDFLTTLGSYASEGVLFATHSIGLARASSERIYSVRRIAEGQSEVAQYDATPRLSEFLGELSFSGYRELGFNKILLVEGSTEIKTIQQFLRLYKKDHQIVPLPLGGSQMINGSRVDELEEIKRISPDIFALIDSERSQANDPLSLHRQAFVDLCCQTKITCHVLEFRATENYLTDRAVKAVKGEKYRALQPYEKLGTISPSWGKDENWRIAREMTKEEIGKTDLGEFLASL